MHILSIQSSVAYGHVGNSAAVFPLQRLGHEVWPVPTVLFSNHPGYGSLRGRVLDPADVAEVIDGIADRGVLGSVDAVLTGYLGAPGTVEVALSAVSRVKAANPGAIYCCDPVLGDEGRGVYVRPGIPELVSELLLPHADILTPNVFELGYLAGSGSGPAATAADTATIPGLLSAVDRLRARGPGTVLVTSVQAGGAADTVGMLAADASGAFLVRTPCLPLTAKGAGDVAAALFLAQLGATPSTGVDTALARVASSLFAILRATMDLGWTELALVAAQSAIADPPCEFPVSRIR